MLIRSNKLTDFLLNQKGQKDLLKDKFIAPEIISKKVKPNIISDIYSIGAIMKFLLETTESYSDIYFKLIEDCLQIDTDRRIQFNILSLNPCFTSNSLVYKLFRGNLWLNIRKFLHLHL